MAESEATTVALRFNTFSLQSLVNCYFFSNFLLQRIYTKTE